MPNIKLVEAVQISSLNLGQIFAELGEYNLQPNSNSKTSECLKDF